MIRIVHLQELFSKMKIPSECEIHCSFAVIDPILFGYKTPEEIRAEESVILTEELEEELRKLQNFCPIFLNEIV